MTELVRKLDFQTDGAVPDRTVVLDVGEDIEPFDDEPVKPFMEWREWDTGFQS